MKAEFFVCLLGTIKFQLSAMDPEMHPASSFSCKSFFYFAQHLLRVLVIASTVAAAAIMATSRQTVSLFGIDMEASYSYSPALKFSLVADCVACGLSVLSVMLLVSLHRPKSNPKKYFYLMLHDMVSLLLLLSGCSAAMGVGYVGRYGMSQTGWMPVCDRVPKFCDKMVASVALSFAGVVCLLLLTLMSAYKLKSY